VILLRQLSLRLEPIVLIPSVYATAFEVYFVRSVPDFLQTWPIYKLGLRLLGFNHLVFYIFHACRHGFRFHIFRISF
jgi:hypothetical protein